MNKRQTMYLYNTDHALEYSFSQKCFHIEPLIDTIRKNRSLLMTGGCTDYVIVGIFKTYEDARRAAEYSRKYLIERKT